MPRRLLYRFDFVRLPVRILVGLPSILTEHVRDFIQSLHVNAGAVPSKRLPSSPSRSLPIQYSLSIYHISFHYMLKITVFWDVTPFSLVTFTYVSKKRVASVFRFTMKMEANVGKHLPRYKASHPSKLYNHHRENLKYFTLCHLTNLLTPKLIT
jgi:hypothetical protein